MFTEKQLERYADVLIWGVKTARTNKFKKGDIIAVGYHLPAVKLAEIVFSKLMKMGMNPIVRALRTPRMEKSFLNIQIIISLFFNRREKKNYSGIFMEGFIF